MVERQLPKLDTRVRFPSPAKLLIISYLRQIPFDKRPISDRKSEQNHLNPLMFAIGSVPLRARESCDERLVLLRRGGLLVWPGRGICHA